MSGPDITSIPLPLDTSPSESTKVTVKKSAKEMLQEALKDHKVSSHKGVNPANKQVPGKPATVYGPKIKLPQNITGGGESSQSIVDELFKDFIAQKFNNSDKDKIVAHETPTLPGSSSSVDEISKILDMEIHSIRSSAEAKNASKSEEILKSTAGRHGKSKSASSKHRTSSTTSKDKSKSGEGDLSFPSGTHIVTYEKSQDNIRLPVSGEHLETEGLDKMEENLKTKIKSETSTPRLTQDKIAESCAINKTLDATSASSIETLAVSLPKSNCLPIPGNNETPRCQDSANDSKKPETLGPTSLTLTKKLAVPRQLGMKLSTESLSLIQSKDRIFRDGRVLEEGEVHSSHSEESDKGASDSDLEHDGFPSDTGSINSKDENSKHHTHSSKHKKKHKHKHKKKKKKSSKGKEKDKEMKEKSKRKTKSSKDKEKGKSEGREKEKEKGTEDEMKSKDRHRSSSKEKRDDKERRQGKGQGKHGEKNSGTKKSSHDKEDSSSKDRQSDKEHEGSKKKKTETDRKRKGSHSRSRSPKRHKKSKSRSRSKSPKSGRSLSSSRRSKYNEWDARRYSDEFVKHSSDRSRSRSRERHRYSSRDKSKSHGSDKDLRLQIDKTKLRKIAIQNALNNMKAGQGPQLDVTSVKSGGKSVEELTEFCKKISEKSKDCEFSDTSEEEVAGQSDEEDTLIHHPFRMKDSSSSNIVMNIRNARQLPVLTPSEKQAQQAALRQTFPVSSGSHHRASESEWVPVDKKTPSVSAPATKTGHSAQRAAIEAPPPPEEPKKQESIFSDQTEAQKIDIGSIISERLQAVRKLQENPDDVQALCKMHKVQEQASKWASSKHLPGQFTGSTGAQVLSQEELIGNRKHQAWTKKTQLTHAAPVNGGIGMFLLQKMGWKQGEGLGKNNEGNKEPLMLDIKIDRKGLTTATENPRHKAQVVQVPRAKDLSGKHPVSALMELCNKRRWGPPAFTVVSESGPDHKKNFLFKVKVNNIEYQPSVPSSNKKMAKAQCAAICLQEMGLIPRDAPINI